MARHSVNVLVQVFAVAEARQASFTLEEPVVVVVGSLGC